MTTNLHLEDTTLTAEWGMIWTWASMALPIGMGDRKSSENTGLPEAGVLFFFFFCELKWENKLIFILANLEMKLSIFFH